MLERQSGKHKVQKNWNNKGSNVKELKARSRIFYESKEQKAKCKKSILLLVKNIKSHTLKTQMFNKPNSNSQKVSRSQSIKAKC